MNNLKEKLIKFGMFEKEADAYLKLLPKGEAILEDLLDEQTEYSDAVVALDSLADKQLINKVKVMDRIYYKAEDPEVVMQNLKIKIAQAQMSKEKIDRAMINLNWIYKQQDKNEEFECLKGYDGVLELRKKMFSQKFDKIYNITSLHKNLPENHIQSMLGHVTQNFYLIIHQSDREKLMSIRDIIFNEPKLKIRILDNEFCKEKQEILIFGSTVAFGNIESHQSFNVFNNKYIAETMENIFMTLWSIGEKF